MSRLENCASGENLWCGKEGVGGGGGAGFSSLAYTLFVILGGAAIIHVGDECLPPLNVYYILNAPAEILAVEKRSVLR